MDIERGVGRRKSVVFSSFRHLFFWTVVTRHLPPAKVLGAKTQAIIFTLLLTRRAKGEARERSRKRERARIRG
jgi:hypothetical protein